MTEVLQNTGQTPNIPSLLCRRALAHFTYGSLSGGTATTTAFLPTGDLVSLCEVIEIWFSLFSPRLGFNSLVGGIMGFSILLSAEVFKHNSSVWFLDGSIGVLIGLTIFAYGIKWVSPASRYFSIYCRWAVLLMEKAIALKCQRNFCEICHWILLD